MTTIIAHVGDLHVNSKVSLCPETMIDDDGQIITPSKSQLWVRKNWLDYWSFVWHEKQRLNAKVYTVINGDWGDINRHSKYQLTSFNESDILRWMVATIQPAIDCSNGIFIVRGTEAHTGGSGWLEEQAAKQIGAIPDGDNASWYLLRGTFDGVRILSTHHPGTNSTRPWTIGGAANRAAAMVESAFYGQQWQPDLAIFGHVHHNEDSFDNHKVRAIFNRCWHLKDAYSYRAGFGIQTSIIGGLLVYCDAGGYRVEKKVYKLPEREVWTT